MPLSSFKVPSGEDRLNMSIAYPGNPANGLNARVRFTLIDPTGRLAAYSLPQGQGNYGRVDVREPVAGTWTGIIFSDEASIDGTNGTIPWQVSTQRFVPFGSVSPSHFTLAPGASQTLQVSATTPSSPGDASGSIVVTASGDNYDQVVGEEHNSIAVTLRSLVDLNRGGNFSGVLTGGNGRDCCLSPTGQVQYYEFNVGPGHHGITANVSLTNDAGDNVGAYLVNPDGVAVGFGQNSVDGTNGLSLTANTLDPVPGTWTLIVDFRTRWSAMKFRSPTPATSSSIRPKSGRPDCRTACRPRCPQGSSVVVPVSITNTGSAPQQYFIDARLNTKASLKLPLQFPPNPAPPNGCGTKGFPLPLGSTCGYYPQWIVPTQTSSVQPSAIANLPVEFDFSPSPGDPDIFGAPMRAQHRVGIVHSVGRHGGGRLLVIPTVRDRTLPGGRSASGVGEHVNDGDHAGLRSGSDHDPGGLLAGVHGRTSGAGQLRAADHQPWRDQSHQRHDHADRSFRHRRQRRPIREHLC